MLFYKQGINVFLQPLSSTLSHKNLFDIAMVKINDAYRLSYEQTT